MAVAVICEFNPFHNGHQYLLSRARELSGEGIIAVMSGAFTQRGEVAICSKSERAAAALKNGADLVVELPAAFAVANAEKFAFGGVETAKLFGCVNHLAFGCETDDLQRLTAAAFARDNPLVNKIIAEQMSLGEYYPRANELAVRQVLGDEIAELLAAPNNILAAEYIRALRGSSIKPLAIKRRGAAHDSSEVSGKTASASYIRGLLRGGEDACGLLPELPREITYPQSLDRVILYKLRNMTAEELRTLPDVGEGLENRIISAARESTTAEELIDRVKTKRYTRARICRIIASALIGITDKLQNEKLSYARVLGFTPEGEKMLKSCTGKIVTSPAKTDALDFGTISLLAADIRSSDTAALAYKPVKPCGEDYLTKIVKVNSAN